MKIKFLLILAFSIIFQFKVLAQWADFDLGVTAKLNCVSVVNAKIWVGGDYGVIRRSNNGINWASLLDPIPGLESCINIFAISDSEAFSTTFDGTNARVYRHYHDGEAWGRQVTQTGGYFNAVWMRSNSKGIVIGNPVGGRWSIWKTIDGIAWDSVGVRLMQSGLEKGKPNSLYVKGDSVWFGTDNSRIYFSPNFGASWVVQLTPGVTEINSIYFNPTGFGNPGEGYAGGSGLVRTTDWGNTWTVVSSLPGAGSIVGIVDNPPVTDLASQIVWVARTDSKIYRTVNGGTTWTTDYTSPSGNYTYLGRNISIQHSKLYATKNNGLVSENDANISGITPVPGEIPFAFSLSQNYPNPFNPTTNIKFDIPKSGFVKLTIYDQLGRGIASLINSEMKAGSYNSDWDASSYSSGIYFYKLESGDFAETKKMILIK